MAARARNGRARSSPPARPRSSRSTTTSLNERNVTHFLAFSPDNPSSIRNCFELARSNARAVRTAITGEMWEAINSAYLELRRYDAADARIARSSPASSNG